MEKAIRQIEQSPIIHGDDEDIAYTLDTSPWGGSPSSVSVVVKLNGQNMAGLLTGSPTVDGDVITLPKISGLTAEAKYRLKIKFTTSTNVVEAWADLIGQE